MNDRADNIKYAVEMKGIVRKYGDFLANDGINLAVKSGEVHAILGENGAGKSTLMNVLYGLCKPTSGNIYINGKLCAMEGPSDAIANGIGMVHQHFMLVQPFTVTENIVLGIEPVKGMILDMKTAKRKVLEISELYNMHIDPDARIADISVGMQQKTEILKVLYRGADILILDEPTASLTPQEIEELIGIIKRLAAEGKTVILITHKLKEITAVADRCTIIREGKCVDTVDVGQITEHELAARMVGREVTFEVEKMEQKLGEVVLEVRNLHACDYRKVEILKGLSMDVRAGEIVGIAGVDGNGQIELVEVLTGLRKAVQGTVTVNGKDAYNITPRQAYDLGITSIPADRQKHDLVLEFTVAENMILQNYMMEPFAKKGILKKDRITKHASKLIDKFGIRPADCENREAGTLSGGNQQKIIIAREVTNDKDLLIAVNPTRGLDVGAIEFVHKYLVEQRNKGKAVLIISFDLDEIMSLSDRIDVIFEGKIVGMLDGQNATEREIGFMMAGGIAHENV